MDGLRAVAVLLVVVFHAAYANVASLQQSSPFVAVLLRQCCHGVDLFFVLSGFCLSYPILLQVRAEGAASFNVAGYAARRVVRILPPYYAAIALFVVVALVLGRLHMPLNGSMSTSALTPGALTDQLLFLDAKHDFLNASFWTLAIEFRWYFLFPIVLLVWVRSPRAFALVGVAAFLLGETQARNVDFQFLSTFMLGIVAAHLYIYPPRRRLPLLVAPFLALPLAIYSTAGSGWAYYAGPLWGPAMFSVVLAVGSIAALRRFIAARALVAVGAVSYSVYLVHQPVMEFFVRYAWINQQPLLRAAVAMVLAVGFGFAFSAFVEQPFLRGSARRRLLPVLESTFQRVLSSTGLSTHLSLETMPRRLSDSLPSPLFSKGVAEAAARDSADR